MDSKVSLLNLIKEHKHILFEKFSNTLTHEIKVNKWKEIQEHANELKIFNKDWKYLRDVTWQNWRKRSMDKRNKKRTAKSEDIKKLFKFDESDKIIFDIIGYDEDGGSNDGLNSSENSDDNTIKPKIENMDETSNDPISNSVKIPSPNLNYKNITPSRSSPIDIKPKRLRRKRTSTAFENDNFDEIKSLRKNLLIHQSKLIIEQIQVAQRQRYKLDLELLKMEKQLKLQPSVFTKEFYNIRDDDDVAPENNFSFVNVTNNEEKTQNPIADTDYRNSSTENLVQTALNTFEKNVSNDNVNNTTENFNGELLFIKGEPITADELCNLNLQ